MDNRFKSVYVMRNKRTGLIKVGISNNVDKRAKSISSASGCEIDILYRSEPITHAHTTEAAIHERLMANNTLGEWFDVDSQQAISVVKEEIKSGITPTKVRPQKTAPKSGNHISSEGRVEMYLNGVTVSDIARAASVSRQAVISSLKRAGVHDPTNPGGRPSKEETWDDWFEDKPLFPKPPFNIEEMNNQPRKDGTITNNLYKDDNRYVVFDWKGGGATYYNSLQEIKEHYNI